jgi:PTH1 family peptidyl-tRNA hydrolase
MNIVSFFRALFPKKARLSGIKFLIVGLGNPGEQYRNSRHNIGFAVADHCISQMQHCLRFDCCQSSVVRGSLEGENVAVAFPQTFMNRSGVALSQLIRDAGIPVQQCLVVLDDFALPLGGMRLRKSGTDGGHNGLKSIISELGTDSFPRLRVGIGPKPANGSIIDFVLGKFDPSEQQKVDTAVNRAGEVVSTVVKSGFDVAMSWCNRQ